MIVDLSCPFVDGNAACALFDICLELLLEDRSNVGRIVALDETHKVWSVHRERKSMYISKALERSEARRPLLRPRAASSGPAKPMPPACRPARTGLP